MRTLFFFLLTCSVLRGDCLNRPVGRDSSLQHLVVSLEADCHQIHMDYREKINAVYHDLALNNKTLVNREDIRQMVGFLYRNDSLNQELHNLRLNEFNDIRKLKYQKGLQIIRLLYEKILSLDHHFSAVRSWNEISQLSNPNHYPDFLKLKDLLNKQTDKKKTFNLGAVLEKNVYTATFFSILQLFNSNSARDQKEADIQSVECVLDLTLQLYQDVKTIYFETTFLQQSNDLLKSDIEQLFRDYTKPIRYDSTLSACRNNDDWDRVGDLLNNYLLQMKMPVSTVEDQTRLYKLQVNMEFPIDRLLQFISTYNYFIVQGQKYYEKFNTILAAYQNNAHCSAALPAEFNQFKTDINQAIDKFKTAYKPVEINGSKLKELLYGVNEFE